MALSPGSRVGAYEIIALIGAGGMGEVYRARDPKLKRDVAIKVLPPAFAADPERLQRFEREARAAAALNHPNILAVHDIGRQADAPYIVSELLEGETLRARVAEGALPARKAVDYAIQIAQGLAAAHARGIVHRDVKPENVFITLDGRVKILDFGLAKLAETDLATPGPNGAATVAPLSQAGVVLGTVGYMSPEQVRGADVDARSDLFSLGAVIYEMLCGRRAFSGPSAVEAMNAILKEDPPDAIGPDAVRNLSLERIVRRCLEKSPEERFQSARDLAFALGSAAEQSSASATVTPVATRLGRPSWNRVAIMVVLAAALGAGAAWSLRDNRATLASPPEMRFSIDLPDGVNFGSGRIPYPVVALSPDGRLLAYTPGGRQSWLSLRRLGELGDKRIEGSEGANTPFFSPDGKWIGFFTTDGKLKKLSVDGGAITTIGDAFTGEGATWLPDNSIIFGDFAGLLRVSDGGGVPQPWTTVDRAKKESSHAWPQLLPDLDTVIFTVEDASKPFDDARIEAQSIRTGERRVLIDGGSFGRYVPTGHLVYARSNALRAVPFDLRRLSVTGPPVEIVSGVPLDVGTGASQFTFSETGHVIFLPGVAEKPRVRIVRVDRRGTMTPIVEDAPYIPSRFRLSPDGRQVAMQVTASNDDLWLFDVERGTRERLTTEFENFDPVWRRDGRGLVFASDRAGPFNLWSLSLDRRGAPQRLTTSDLPQTPTSIAPDDSTLLFHEFASGASGYDIMALSLDGDGKPREFLKTRFNELGAQFSPDGRLVAYISDETGRNEVHLRNVSGEGRSLQVSFGGGVGPIWAPDGGEIFFRNDEEVFAAAVSVGPPLTVGRSRRLFAGQFSSAPAGSTQYDVMPDGNSFIMVQPYEQSVISRMVVVVNWLEELRRLVPTK